MSSSKLVPPVAAALAVVSAAILMLAAASGLSVPLAIFFGIFAIACITALYFTSMAGSADQALSALDAEKIADILRNMVESQPADLAGLPPELAEPLSRLSARLEVLSDELDELSPRDELTSLAKEEVFNNVLWREFNRSERYDEPMSVVLLSIQDFDNIRESRGAAAADELLREVASLVLRMVRETDLAARYGDDRLAVIMPGTDSQGAGEFAQRFKKDLDESDLGAPGTAALKVAIGVASLPEEGTKTAPELVKKAAAALKAAGDDGSGG